MFDKEPKLETNQAVLEHTETEVADQNPDLQTDDSESETPLILDELVIEEVNIDGMCGVY